MKNIVVVAEKSLRKHAIGLVHGLSKLDNVKAVYWTPNVFLKQEIKNTRTAVIFIGKNSVSEPYIDLIVVKKVKHGVAWGYDKTKAVVFIESFPENDKELEEDIKRLSIIAKEHESKSEDSDFTTAAGMTVSVSIVSIIAGFSIIIIPPTVFFAFLLNKLFKFILRKKQIKKLQITYGLLAFSQECLDGYINKLP